MNNRILAGVSICALALFGCLTEGLAQHAYFPMKGRITFEKEVYVRARMREMQGRMAMNRWGGSMNPNDMPEKSSTMFVLQFDEDETLMVPQETGQSGSGGRLPVARTVQGRNRSRARPVQMGSFASRQQQKTYYQNLRSGETEIAIEMDEKYLLKDSLQVITWRFTDEYRDIAGYECRRVNGATADSLYLVAFYTDQIPVSGGPVLAGGLPGMILGLAIPEIHINYWARQVDFTVDNVPKQWRDKKSKALSMEDFFRSLANNPAFGGRGQSEAQRKRNVLEGLVY